MKVTQNPPKFLSRKCGHFAFVIIEGQLLLGLQSVLWLSSETKRLCDIYNRHLNMIMVPKISYMQLRSAWSFVW